MLLADVLVHAIDAALHDGEITFNRVRVPEIAAAHHEKLDGTGYPLGLKENQLSLQARIIGVADIFEALTAKDRPYKKPMNLSQALKILNFMKLDGHIDPNIHELFINNGLHREYAAKELDPDQIDDEALA